MAHTRRDWPPEERALLEQLWPDHTVAQIREHIARPPSSISSKAKELGLPPHRAPRWAPADVAIVDAAVEDLIARLSAQLERSPVAVANKISRAAMRKRGA